MSDLPDFSSARHPLPDGRELGYSHCGTNNAADALLCLPGLLETRQCFDPLLQAAHTSANLRVISLDYCGRGDSTPLPGDQGYTLSRYLEDLTHFLNHAQVTQGVQRFHVLGTSMGGILAMYLASNPPCVVQTVLLNDVGLSLYWVSLYSLYDTAAPGGRASSVQAMAAQWGVTPGAVLAVQSPTHFDLPYRRDWKGMRFASLLASYNGAIRLIRGVHSNVCLPEQVRELTAHFPHARVWDVAHAAHPVAFEPQVCDFVLAELTQPTLAAREGAVPQGAWAWLKRQWHKVR